MDESLVGRLESIERRLEALEGRFVRPPAPPVQAPPVQAPPFPRSAPSADLESELASRWLPRAGAAAVVAAIAYLVGLGIDRGLITPSAVAGGIGLICAAVALLGSRLRAERETFGNVLVGMGAGGLYVDAVGANLYREMLSGQAMVALCVVISLATLGFGARRALPSFLGVGLFGGLLAALMPLSKGSVSLAAGLFFVVIAPTFGVAAFRRWPMAVAASWIAAFAAALPFLFASGALFPRLAPLDAALLMALAAWGWAAEPLPESDPGGVFPFPAAAATGVAALITLTETPGAAHVAILGLVTSVGLFRRTNAGRRVGLAGLVLALGIAPLGLRLDVASAVLALFALSTAAYAWGVERRREGGGRTTTALAAAQAILALGAYALRLASSGEVALEPGLIALLAAAAVAVATVAARPEGRVAGGVVVWALATRLGIVSLGLEASTAVTAAWIATFAGLLAVGFSTRRPEVRQLGLVVAAVTAAKVVLVDLSGLDAATKAGVLLVLGLVFLAGGYAYVRWTGARGEASEP